MYHTPTNSNSSRLKNMAMTTRISVQATQVDVETIERALAKFLEKDADAAMFPLLAEAVSTTDCEASVKETFNYLKVIRNQQRPNKEVFTVIVQNEHTHILGTTSRMEEMHREFTDLRAHPMATEGIRMSSIAINPANRTVEIFTGKGRMLRSVFRVGDDNLPVFTPASVGLLQELDSMHRSGNVSYSDKEWADKAVSLAIRLRAEGTIVYLDVREEQLVRVAPTIGYLKRGPKVYDYCSIHPSTYESAMKSQVAFCLSQTLGS
jgi:hypothetical protein